MHKRTPLAALVCAAGFLSAAVITKNPELTYIFTQTTRYQSAAWLTGQDRFPSGAALELVAGGVTRALAPGFFASADAAVSFDGKRVLFAGKRTAADTWQIWEVALAGGAPRRITEGTSQCIRPLYLPDDRIVYTRLTPEGSYLETAALTGGSRNRLTFAPARVLTDDVLADGRILFESQQPGRTSRELLTVYPDGTGVEAVRCEHGPDRSEARQIGSGDIVFNVGTRLARFTSACATQREVVQPPGEISGPVAEVSPEDWLVALKTKAGRFGLYRSRAGQVALLDSPAVQPVVVTERVPPKRFPSALVPARTWGNLLCLDARAFRSSRHVGEVARVRAYTTGTGRSDALLGETEVEHDGSFYIQVPADRPLRIELVDASGRRLEGEHGWFWMRPAEQRICTGCHNGPERSPENKVPDILLHTIVPVDMRGGK